MIPKIIHQIWLGGKPIPDHIKSYMETVNSVLSDYEIRIYTDKDLDLSKSQFAMQALLHKRYAFAADYARFLVLRDYGGVYLDTDMKMLKPLDSLLVSKSFIGKENKVRVASGVLGFEPNHSFVNEMIDYYETLQFPSEVKERNLPVINDYFTKVYRKYLGNLASTTEDYTNKDVILPVDVFYPLNWRTRELKITDRTLAIHMYEGSWLDKNIKEEV